MVLLTRSKTLHSYVGGSVSGLTGFWTGLMKGVGAGTRVFQLLDRHSAIPLGTGSFCPKERNGLIRLENVSFTYPSRKQVGVLNGVDLEINVGDSLAIVCVLLSVRARLAERS